MREEVEALLGHGITDGQMADALEAARRKQARILAKGGSPLAASGWYLARLCAEQARASEMMEATGGICRILLGKGPETENERPA